MSAPRLDPAAERDAEAAFEARLALALESRRFDRRALRRSVARRAAGRAGVLLALGGLWFAAERWRAPAADAAAPQEAPGDVAPIAARRTTPATPRARTSERDEAAPVEAIPAPAPPESDPDAGTGMR